MNNKEKTKFEEKPFFKQKGYSMSVKFSKEQYKKINDYCEENFITHTNLVRFAVGKYLNSIKENENTIK